MGLLPELIGVLGGEVVDRGILTALLFHLRVAFQVGFKAVGHIVALRDDAHALRECFPLERRDDLRGDYAALAVASYFRALADELAPQGPDCRDWHDLVVRSLDALPGAANLVGELLAFELEVLGLMGLWSGVAPEGGSFALRGERRFDVSAAAAKCLAAPRAEKNFASLLDAARAIGVFYTFHVDVAPEARRLALQIAAKTTQERLRTT